jgi:pyroglutamyl-peptidase
VLPCTYYGAFEMLSEKIDELAPDPILGSGLASGIRCIRLEAVGRNVMNGKYADTEGMMPNYEPILEQGDLYYTTNADNIALANSLIESGIPAEVSLDAEGFICNSLIYLTAKRIHDEALPIGFAYFHTPWTEDYADRLALEVGQIAIKKSDLMQTIEILLKK